MKLFLLIFSLIFSSTLTASTNNIILGKTLCSDNKEICFKASIDYDNNSSKLEMHGRLKKTVGSGQIKIHLTGSNNNENTYAVIEIETDGNYSEIIKGSSTKIYSADRNTKWEIDNIYFHQ